ncbi:MAG: AbrB family transcriptional regulator [Thermoproteota archaeon]
MALVKVDSQRRIYIPKDVPFEAGRALLVPFGSSFLLIPVPDRVVEIDVGASVEELRRRAEEKAREEAGVKLGRRGEG